MKKTESEFCARFMEAARRDGWVPYPETSGWDLVLVWSGSGNGSRTVGGPILEGTQVGVEAKLRPSVEVLCQAYRRVRFHSREKPHHAAVLVPKASRHFKEVAEALSLGVYTEEHCADYSRFVKKTRWPEPRPRFYERRYIGPPSQRLEEANGVWIPPVVPGGPAGVPSPSPLTPWRVSAIRLCNRLREKGYVTSSDFKELGIRAQTFLDQWWIKRDFTGTRTARYVAIPGAALPDTGFEREATELGTG